MINSIQTSVTAVAAGASVTPLSISVKEIGAINPATPVDTTRISTLSSQLSESAVRADARDRSESRAGLGEMAERILNKLVGDVYQFNKATHNREVPETSDPELLKRAKQATEFLTQKFAGDYTGKNPFSGLTREQLSVIIYDEEGPYTVNERRAAWSASQDLEQQWRKKLMADGWAESASTGKKPKFYAEVLAHYESLPLIEQAQYPTDYESRIQARIDAAESEDEPEEDDFLNLVQILAKQCKPEKADKEVDETKADSDTKTSNLSPDASPTPVAALRS